MPRSVSGGLPGVRVRLFAALREAAGTAELVVPGGPLAGILDDLNARFGEPFATRLGISSVLVDGQPCDPGEDRQVTSGSEVVLLPPFSGGARPVIGGRLCIRLGTPRDRQPSPRLDSGA